MFTSGQPQNQTSEKRKLAFLDNHPELYEENIEFSLARKPNSQVKNVQQKTPLYREIDRVHKVIAEQASEIVNLKTALQSQELGFKNQLAAMQQINEKLIADMERMQIQITGLQPVAPQPLTPSSPTLIFRAPSPSISFHMPEDVPNVNPKEVEEFLRLVAEGEQGKAEDLLKRSPAIAF